jgi:SAM-dependent methyltransferase
MKTNDSNILKIKNFNNDAYKKYGFLAQRKYPNEELCRFMGRNFFSKNFSFSQKQQIKILETGCGSGANLWMLAKEGFDVYGVDTSEEAIILSEEVLRSYKVNAALYVQNMMNPDFPDNFFDVVVDVFSSCCLDKEERKVYLKNVKRILKVNGLFFSYFPSKKIRCIPV